MTLLVNVDISLVYIYHQIPAQGSPFWGSYHISILKRLKFIKYHFRDTSHLEAELRVKETKYGNLQSNICLLYFGVHSEQSILENSQSMFS